MPFFPSFIPTANAIQTSANELALVFLINNCFSDAYKAWHGAYRHRHNNLLSPTHDVCWTNSLDLIAAKLHLTGQPADAKSYLEESINEKERTGGVGVEKSRVALGRALAAQGKYLGAEGEMGIALRAEILSMQDGKVKEAEKLARKVVKARERTLGVNAQETLESVWLLGSVVEKLGRKGQAKGLYRRAYEGGRTLLEEGHVDIEDYKRDYERLGDEGWMDVGSWLY